MIVVGCFSQPAKDIRPNDGGGGGGGESKTWCEKEGI